MPKIELDDESKFKIQLCTAKANFIKDFTEANWQKQKKLMIKDIYGADDES